MSQAHGDATTMSAARAAAPAPQERPRRATPGPAASRSGPDTARRSRQGETAALSARRIGVDPASPPPRPRRPGDRSQVVVVVNLLDETGSDALRGDELTAAGTTARSEVFGRAVVDVHEVSEAFGGETVAVLGSRVVATFPFHRAADAVAAAVEMQRDATRSASGPHRWSCAVGVVAGEVIDHPAFSRLGLRAVAPVVDRALLVSRSAAPGTVLVDERTASPAASAGAVTDRSERSSETPDAAGAEGQAVVGAPSSWTVGSTREIRGESGEIIACHEIDFDAHAPTSATRVSVSTSSNPGRSEPRAARSTGRRSRPANRPEGRVVSEAALRRRPWSEGRVFCWFSDRGRGVITSTTGQEFYVDRRFLAVGSELAAGDHVYFVPRDPVARGRNPVAGAVLHGEARMEVRIETQAEDGTALAVVSDSNGTDQVLPVDVSAVGTVAVGEWLRVRIAGRDGGPVGEPA
jgi:hypothetical protein